MTRPPPPVLALLAIAVLGVVTVAAAFAAVGFDAPPSPPPQPPEVMYLPVETTLPLQVGDRLPPLTAGGWANGPPPKFDDPGVKLLVVDVWGMWCPYCASTAPAQVRLHQKYAEKGVRFVALTNTSEGGLRRTASGTR